MWRSYKGQVEDVRYLLTESDSAQGSERAGQRLPPALDQLKASEIRTILGKRFASKDVAELKL